MRSALEIALTPHAERYGDHTVGHDEHNCGACKAAEALDLCMEIDYKETRWGTLEEQRCVASAHHKGSHRWREVLA